MKAAVLYYSHKGKTAGYAREIAMYLWSKGLNVSLSSISDAVPEKLSDCDFLVSGCWTCGWFVVGQHPHKRWKAFSRRIRGLVKAERTIFFTTYKFRTGSMYTCMKRTMGIPVSCSVPFLKSRTGFLTESDKKQLDQFIAMYSIH